MDIEWLEGSLLYQAFRFAHGLPVYDSPRLGYFSLAYPPLYFLAVGGFGRIFGIDYTVARSLSIAGFALACVSAGWSIARDATPGLRALLVLLICGAMAATFPATGGWYDHVRVDSLAMGFLGCAVVLVERIDNSWRWSLLAGLMLTAVVFTQHSYMLCICWLIGFSIFRYGRAGRYLAAVSLTSAVAGLVILLIASRGWFWTWMVQLANHEIRPRRLLLGAHLVLADAPYLIILPLLTACAIWRRSLRARSFQWLGLLASSVPLSLLTFAKVGGYLNDLIPMLLTAPVSMVAVTLDVADSLRVKYATWGRIATVAMVALFLVTRGFAADRYLPSTDDWSKARLLNDFISSLDGRVLVPSHPFLAVRNGKGDEQLSVMGYWDLRDAGRASPLDIRRYVQQIDPSWLVLANDRRLDGWIVDEAKGQYEFARHLPNSPTFGMPYYSLGSLYRRVQ
jgi:hypothetical protein